MDVAQFLEFMLGSQLATTKTDPKATRKALLDKAQQDLRSVIETTMPVVYLVKAKEIVNNMLVALQQMDEVTLSKYISSVEDEITGARIFPTDPEFDTAFDSVYNELVADYQSGRITRLLIKRLSDRFNKKIDLPTLGKKVSEINSVMDSATNAYAVTLSLGTQADTTAVSNSLRSEIQKAGKDLRTYLSANTPAQFTDAAEILQDFDGSSEILIVGATFKGLKDAINELASPIIREWMESHNLIPTKNLTVGIFTVAGHVAVKDTLEEVIGINTPLTQSTLYYANQVAESNLTMDTFVLDSTHIDCALTVKKDVDTFKSLLSLNFSFIVSQEFTYNSGVFGKAEVKAMDAIVAKVFKTTRDRLKDNFIKSIVSTKGLTYLVSKLRFSPTLGESIALQVASILKGESPAKVLGIGSAKNVSTEVAKHVQKRVAEAAKKVSKKSSASSGAKKARTTKTSEAITSGLSGLMVIINQHLQDVISANMGDGSRKDILNYRSGRFASTVKVETISKSRDGMITAFYSYMKNPYASFSQGGKQQYPKTRDPKLLISTSIREIAAQNAVTRMRAVAL